VFEKGANSIKMTEKQSRAKKDDIKTRKQINKLTKYKGKFPRHPIYFS